MNPSQSKAKKRDRPSISGWSQIRASGDSERLLRWCSDYGWDCVVKLDHFATDPYPLLFAMVEMGLTDEVRDVFLRQSIKADTCLSSKGSAFGLGVWHHAVSSNSPDMLNLLADRCERLGINVKSELSFHSKKMNSSPISRAQQWRLWKSLEWCVSRYGLLPPLETAASVSMLDCPQPLFEKMLSGYARVDDGFAERFALTIVGNLRSPHSRSPGEEKLDRILPLLIDKSDAVCSVLARSFEYGETEISRRLIGVLSSKLSVSPRDILRLVDERGQKGSSQINKSPLLGSDYMTPEFIKMLATSGIPMSDWLPKAWESSLSGCKYASVRHLLAVEKESGISHSDTDEFVRSLAGIKKGYRSGWKKMLAEFGREKWESWLSPRGFEWMPVVMAKNGNANLLEYVCANYAEKLSSVLENAHFRESVKIQLPLLPPQVRATMESLVLGTSRQEKPEIRRRAGV